MLVTVPQARDLGVRRAHAFLCGVWIHEFIYEPVSLNDVDHPAPQAVGGSALVPVNLCLCLSRPAGGWRQDSASSGFRPEPIFLPAPARKPSHADEPLPRRRRVARYFPALEMVILGVLSSAKLTYITPSMTISSKKGYHRGGRMALILELGRPSSTTRHQVRRHRVKLF